MQESVRNIHADIIERAQRGEEAAFEQLYSLYKRAMFNTALRLTADRAEAEDVLQDSFISAFQHLKSFRGDSTFGAWLKRIVLNKALNAVRKRSQLEWTEELEQVPQQEEIFGEQQFPFTVIQVNEAIQQLATGYRTVVSLYLIEGYDHEEIGQILGIDENTSKSQLSRAKKKLIQILNQNFTRHE